MHQMTVKRMVQGFREGGFETFEDEVVTEYPLTVYLNDTEFATLICSPEELEDLVTGFLASEGVLREVEHIHSIDIDTQRGMAYVEMTHPPRFSTELVSKRYIASCCGKSRQGFYFFNDVRTVKKLEPGPWKLTVEACFFLMRQLQDSAELFQNTGGVHNAALCDSEGLLLMRTDIGRHNALDKIYGYCLRNGVSMQDKIIAFSGRLSSEVLLKVAKIGCGIVLTKSAPTELALHLAEELGITAVGFIRGDSLNVYTHPERIILQVKDDFI